MDIISILQESEAMLSGHFLLSSGCHSDKYFQCAKLLQYPDKASLVLSVPVQEILAEKNAEKIDFDAVVGPAMGGIIPATSLHGNWGPLHFLPKEMKTETWFCVVVLK